MEKDEWIKESDNIELLRKHYKEKFSVLNMPWLFYFAKRAVEWPALGANAQRCLHDIYFNLCVELTLHLQLKQPWEKIRAYSDNLGTIETDTNPDDFPPATIRRAANATRANKRQKIPPNRFQATLVDESGSGGARGCVGGAEGNGTE
jgi:hypothetical protein